MNLVSPSMKKYCWLHAAAIMLLDGISLVASLNLRDFKRPYVFMLGTKGKHKNFGLVLDIAKVLDFSWSGHRDCRG